MRPSIEAFSDELVKISKWQPPTKDELAELGKSVAMYGGGLAIGSAAGYAARKKLMPKLIPVMGPKLTDATIYGGGALTGLLGGAALKKILKRAKDARERDS